MEPTADGTLGKTPLAHLLVYCVDRKLTGGLIFRPEGDVDPANADVITLVDGFPAKICIADPPEPLGRILLENGAIDDATYNESLHALGTGGKLHGQILLESGKIDAVTLERALRGQIARKLGHLFGRPATTTYAFYDKQDFLQRYGGPELFPVDPMPTLWSGIRMHPSMPHVDAALERVSTFPLRIKASASLTSFELSRGEREVIELLRLSPSTPAQVIGAGVCEERNVRLLIYALLLTKQLEVVSESERASLPPRVSMPMPSRGPLSTIPSEATKPALGRTPSQNVAKVQPLKMSTPVTAGVLEQGGGDGGEARAGGGGPVSVRRATIVQRAATIAKENYFQMLGISDKASLEDAKTAYFALAKKWHPDRIPAELADVKPAVAKVFTLLAEAYQTLSDQDRRNRYVQVLREGGGTPEDQAEVARVMEAANAFQKAEYFVSKGSLTEAEPFADKALALDPKEVDYIVVWCWVQANKSERRQSGKYDDLILKLDRAILDVPSSDRARFYRGMVLKLAGRLEAAIKDFREVTAMNPKNVDAAREVRIYNMRNDNASKTKAKEESSGLLGRFLKKK